MTNSLGLYLHIPFCEKKCKYCDFYSSFVTEELLDDYTKALIKSINQWGGGLNSRPIDTIYLGGGTPSLLKHRLPTLLYEVKNSFNVSKNCEITLELNPYTSSESLLEYAKKADINRLSIGAQSGSDSMLKTLGRTHTARDTENTVVIARKMGFNNISLDIMIGLPNSTSEGLKYDLDFISSLSPDHISAYMLKIEENTAFYAQRDTLGLPDDDTQAEQYLQMCSYFESSGYGHYEISNFAKSDKLSRHNLKYWLLDDYLGIGPAAHSLLDGKRFYYPRDLKGFINDNSPLPDGTGGSKEEYIMLRLRLKSGISPKEFKKLFGTELSAEFMEKCRIFKKAELIDINENNISLTNKGMLLSNSIITELLECEI